MTITKRVQKELVQAVPPADKTLRSKSAVRMQHKTQQARSAAERNKGKAWTRDEHARFLVALDVYPSGPWKAIADYVGTKDSRQTMTHAQKYRQKHERQQRGLRNRKNRRSKSEPEPEAVVMDMADISVVAEPPTLGKQQSDSPRSLEEGVSNPLDESLLSLALDAGSAWLGAKAEGDLMQIFTDFEEPVTDPAWPQMWSTNSLEEIVTSCSQFDF
ncbi:Myb-like DNA-binding protein [Phytophthora palmivora]|uniref:Myb-like DNA-binding protein n=1 Tax=Phytophthora palmivora TaxID=4796 RepID=A0A2P4XJY6_9STRA|nr:Myb-like DNA-binding protein [Phytophthora palmivora]